MTTLAFIGLLLTILGSLTFSAVTELRPRLGDRLAIPMAMTTLLAYTAGIAILIRYAITLVI